MFDSDHEMGSGVTEIIPQVLSGESDVKPERKAKYYLDTLKETGEINTAIGLNLVSGAEGMYLDNVRLFYKEIIPEHECLTGFFKDKNIDRFSISVHTVKTMLSTIGAMKLSKEAFQLETASKNKDLAYCIERFPVFNERLMSLNKALSVILQEEKIPAEKETGEPDFLKEQIQIAMAAADDFDNDTGMEVVSRLMAYDFGRENNNWLENVSTAFQSYEFDAAREMLKKLSH